jgi:Major royal jelly protein
MKTVIISAMLLVVSTVLPSAAQGNGRELKLVYENNDFQLTGISVSKEGRVFVNFPRWSPEYLNAVVEVMPDGSAKPFPDENWNRWDLAPKTASQHFVCVQSIVVDHKDALWVLDPAAPMLMSIVPGGPKLVQIDLKTNQVTRVISVPPDVAKTSSYMNDVRFDRRNFAYITDSGLGGIIVVDLSTGKSHRALDGDPSVMPDRASRSSSTANRFWDPPAKPRRFTPMRLHSRPTENISITKPLRPRHCTALRRMRCATRMANRFRRSIPTPSPLTASGWMLKETPI